MKIEVLGTRGEIEESFPRYRKHSGILIDDKLMLDLGEKAFLKRKPKWIFITHLHPDHAYFVRRGKREEPKTEAQIFLPEKAIRAKIKAGPYTIIPIPTHHSKLVKSQAYLVKKGKESILYTGDLVWINKEYHPLFKGIDLVITEASFMKKGGMIRRDPKTGEIFGHNGVPNLMDLFKKSTKKMLFVHFGSWFYKDRKKSKKALIKLGKEKGLEIIVGYDGQTMQSR